MNQSSVHSALKLACNARHDALHQHALLQKLLTPALNKTEYQQILSAFYTTYQPVEQAIQHYLAQHSLPFDYQKRQKCPALIADLQTMNAELPAITDSFSLQNHAQLVGTLYVLEGSSLGGQVIQKRLEQQHPALPSQFFSGYRENTGRYWQEYLSFAERYCLNSEVEHAIQSAQKLFDSLASHLAEPE